MHVQSVVDRGIQKEEWIKNLNGPYMRFDVPLIVPHLLQQLEERNPGELQHIDSGLPAAAYCMIGGKRKGWVSSEAWPSSLLRVRTPYRPLLSDGAGLQDTLWIEEKHTAKVGLLLL